MKRRFTRLPIASIAVVIGCFLVGLSMSQVDAQSLLTNGKVTVRSDGAVYLISNGMRRWVATVVISDEDLNAYPEAEPIYVGLAPFGSGATSTGSTTTPSKTGTTASKSGTSTTKSGSSSSKSGSSSSSSSTSDDDDDDDTSSSSNTPDPKTKTDPEDKDGLKCPGSHQVKGGFDKKYYDVDRVNYLTVEAEACFTSGGDARKWGYTESKKN
jgi:hypothetical protein